MPDTGNDGGAAAALAHGRIISPGTEHQLGTYGLFPPSAAQQRVLTPTTVPLTARNAEPDLLWMGFAELCGGAATSADYRALADQHTTWVIDGVPDPEAASAEKALGWIRFGEAVEALSVRGTTLFLIGHRPLDWERATVAWQGVHVPGAADVPAALAGIARRLAVLVRVESAAGAVPEEGASGS
jgi:cell division protein ZapE